MLLRSSIPEAPWHIAAGNDNRARLNCIGHRLSPIPCEAVPHEEIDLPERVYHVDYERRDLPPGMFVPQRY